MSKNPYHEVSRKWSLWARSIFLRNPFSAFLTVSSDASSSTVGPSTVTQLTSCSCGMPPALAVIAFSASRLALRFSLRPQRQHPYWPHGFQRKHVASRSRAMRVSPWSAVLSRRRTSFGVDLSRAYLMTGAIACFSRTCWRNASSRSLGDLVLGSDNVTVLVSTAKTDLSG